MFGIALLVSMCLLSLCPYVGSVGSQCPVEDPFKRTWNIAIGHDWGAMDYINEGGYVTGFSKMLITEVCAAAGIQCRAIWAPYQQCWDSTPAQHSVGGRGLIGGWFDACTGWYQTVDRIHVFDFSVSFLKVTMAYFYVKPGATFSPDNLQNKNIVFLDGWAADEKCLARQGNIAGSFLADGQVTYVTDTDQLVDILNNNQADAAFVMEDAMERFVADNSVTRMGSGVGCMLSGASMMTRKDNDFVSHWNRGFQEIRNNGRLRALCEEGSTLHGHKGTIPCVN